MGLGAAPVFVLITATLAAPFDTARLHEAAAAGRVQELESAITVGGLDGNARSEDPPWSTALMMAAARRRVGVVRLLLRLGVKVDLQDGQGNTALHYACRVGLTDSVALLLGAGANPNISGVFGETALHIAAQNGHASVVRMLIKAGAQQLPSLNCARPLHLAIAGCHRTVVEALVSAGAKVDEQPEEPASTKPRSKRCQGLPIMRPLPPPDGRIASCETPPPLDLPVKRILEMVGEAWPDAEGARRPPADDTPKPWHAFARAVFIVRRALETLAALPPRSGVSPADLLEGIRSQHGTALFSSAAGLEAGYSALHLASALGHTKAVRQLLRAGASADARAPHDGSTAMHLAAASGHHHVVATLLEAKASIHLGQWHAAFTPLHSACWHGNLLVVRTLLSERADDGGGFGRATQHGGAPAFTPLMVASWSGHGEVVRELLRAGASSRPRWQGLSALDLAEHAASLIAPPPTAQPAAATAGAPDAGDTGVRARSRVEEAGGAEPMQQAGAAWLTQYLPPPIGRKHAMVARLLKAAQPVHMASSHRRDDSMNLSQRRPWIRRWLAWGKALPPREWLASCELTSGYSLVWLVVALAAGWLVVRPAARALNKRSPASSSQLKPPAPGHAVRPPSAKSRTTGPARMTSTGRPAAGRLASAHTSKKAPGRPERTPSPPDDSSAAGSDQAVASSSPQGVGSEQAVASSSPQGVIPTHNEMWAVKQRRFRLPQAATLPGSLRTDAMPAQIPLEPAPRHAAPQTAMGTDTEAILQAEVRRVLGGMGFAEGAARLAAKTTSGVGGTSSLQARVDTAVEWLDSQVRIAAVSSLRPQAAAFECGTDGGGNESMCEEPQAAAVCEYSVEAVGDAVPMCGEPFSDC